jgi:hypothetical protein
MPPAEGWDDEPEPPRPRRPGWGCLAAVIVGGVGLVIAALFAAQLFGATLTDVHIR